MTSVKLTVLASVFCLGWIGAAQAVNCGPACQRYYCFFRSANAEFFRDSAGAGLLLVLEDDNGSNGRYPSGTSGLVDIESYFGTGIVCTPPLGLNAETTGCTGLKDADAGKMGGAAACVSMN